MIKVITANIPASLTERPQWVCWRWGTRDGKLTKVPYQARSPHVKAASDNPATWADFETAMAAYEHSQGNCQALAGVGFVVTAGDPYVGIDMDKCLDPESGKIATWAQEILAKFDTYAEVTPSGTGLRIWLKGELPPAGRKKGGLGPSGEGVLELYEAGRYFAVTGWRLPDKPAEITDCQSELDALHARMFPRVEKPKAAASVPPATITLSDRELIDKASAAKNGASFQSLWNGNTVALGNDQSAADLALCGHLLFWAGGDTAKADQLFRQSGLMRDKWDTRRASNGKTYGQMTMDKAAAGMNEVYQSPASKPASKPTEKSPLSAEKSAPSEWPDPEPLPERGYIAATEYPLHTLPGSIRDAVRAVARFSKVAEVAPAMVGCSVVAVAIGKKLVVVERDGLEHHPAVFFLPIADSGERKSPVFQKMSYPLERWIESQMDAYDSLSRSAKAANDVIDAAISGLRRKAQKESADLDFIAGEIADLEARRRPMPCHPRMFTTDCTEERLVQKLYLHGGAYGVLSGEGRPVLDTIMGKYSGDNRTGDAVYLAGISGDTITRDRVGGESGPEDIAIVKPCLNVCVMVQPDKYLALAAHPSLRSSGALARIWPAWMPPMAGTRFESEDEAPFDKLAMQLFNKAVCDILNSKLQNPHRAGLSDEAAEARRDFHNFIEELMRAGGELADVKDIASKIVSQTAKLAGIFHVLAHPGVLAESNSLISLDTWLCAQQVGEFHLNESVRSQRFADEDSALDKARRILTWISHQSLKVVTTSALMQFSPRPRPNAREAEAILAILTERHYLRARYDDALRKPVYDVRPGPN